MAGLSLSDALSENCCLADIDLSWNKVGDKGARSLLRVVSAQNVLTRLRLVGNQVLVVVPPRVYEEPLPAHIRGGGITPRRRSDRPQTERVERPCQYFYPDPPRAPPPPHLALACVHAQHKKNSKNGRIKEETKVAIEEALRANQLRNKRIQERREADASMGIFVPFGGEDAAKARERAEREADRAGILPGFRWEMPLEPGPEL